MMIQRSLFALLLLAAPLGGAFAAPAGAQTGAQSGPEIGEPAPDFELTDTHAQTHQLDDYHGSWVVLEWFDYSCPYTRKHYRTGNIPSQQEKWTDRGVVWFSVITTPSDEAHDPDPLNALAEQHGNRATAILQDTDGTVGRAYGARTTPHLFVIDPDGRLAYMGGIDDVPTPRDEDLERATQLADQALEQATSGEPVTVPVSRPYGCVVRYQ